MTATIDLAWWNELGPAWQAVFRKRLEFAGDPTPPHLAQIATLERLAADKSEIESLAPITGLPLTHFDFSGCAKLTSYRGFPPTIQILTFHWTKMEDLTWVDDLPNLQKVYCDKALQTKINRRIGANKRKRA